MLLLTAAYQDVTGAAQSGTVRITPTLASQSGGKRQVPKGINAPVVNGALSVPVHCPDEAGESWSPFYLLIEERFGATKTAFIVLLLQGSLAEGSAVDLTSLVPLAAPGTYTPIAAQLADEIAPAVEAQIDARLQFHGLIP